MSVEDQYLETQLAREGPLLPCAHCASSAVLERDPVTQRWAVYCKGTHCGICTPLCSTVSYAIKYWNRRDWIKPIEGNGA